MIEEVLSKIERIEKRKASAFPGICCILVGVLMMLLAITDFMPEGLISELSVSVGLVFLVVGLIKLCRLGDIYTDKVSGCDLTGYHLFFDQQDLRKVETLLSTKRYEELVQLRICPQGGVALHIYGTKEGGLFYLLLMKYVPFQFVPVSEVVEVTDAQELEQMEELIRHSC